MEQAGDQTFAGAGLALEEDRRKALTRLLAIEEPAQLLPDGPHDRAFTEQLDQSIHDRAP
jgi:hypothetical protein